MDTIMTTEEQKSRTARSYKLILLFAMVSMTMMFAGLTSAFVVSKSRADWLKDFQLPPLLLQYCSNYRCSAFYLAKAIKKNNQSKTTLFFEQY
jgi:cytochrome c oxidase subunit 3